MPQETKSVNFLALTHAFKFVVPKIIPVALQSYTKNLEAKAHPVPEY